MKQTQQPCEESLKKTNKHRRHKRGSGYKRQTSVEGRIRQKRVSSGRELQGQRGEKLGRKAKNTSCGGQWGGGKGLRSAEEEEPAAERVAERAAGPRPSGSLSGRQKQKECGALRLGLHSQTYHLLVPAATHGQEQRFPSHIPHYHPPTHTVRCCCCCCCFSLILFTLDYNEGKSPLKFLKEFRSPSTLLTCFWKIVTFIFISSVNIKHLKGKINLFL